MRQNDDGNTVCNENMIDGTLRIEIRYDAESGRGDGEMNCCNASHDGGANDDFDCGQDHGASADGSGWTHDMFSDGNHPYIWISCRYRLSSRSSL